MFINSTLLKINDKPYEIHLYENDLTRKAVENMYMATPISFDVETRGLNPLRDRLCVVQIKQGNKVYVIRKVSSEVPYARDWSTSEHLRSLFVLHASNKYAHYARFDTAFLAHNLQIEPETIQNICCTKYASKLARTTASSHSLKDVVKSLFDIDLDKSRQASNWDNMTPTQLIYAVTDTLYLEEAHNELSKILEVEGRSDLYESLCQAIPMLVSLDLAQFPPETIIGH